MRNREESNTSNTSINSSDLSKSGSNTIYGDISSRNIVRLDGRESNEQRLTVQEATADSILLRKFISCGASPIYSSAIIVFCAVEIKEPPVEKGRQGILAINCSDRRIQMEIDRIFNRSKILPLDRLAVIPNLAVISIRIDIVIANDKGGVLEMATEGIYQTLHRIKVLEEIENRREKIVVQKEIKELMTFHPRTVTCAMQEECAVYDPTDEELSEAAGHMVVTHSLRTGIDTQSMMNSGGNIIYWTFSGIAKYELLKDTVKTILAAN
ncbi:hypothetical protein NEMIN01_1136 [Nematocida minor]|uniref:uncharacterized protein n=1 Tax=Nematocida minor TaxID=1912983 RepID=UPI002220EBC7|nr:uncharacterized protein NEMIN01_1136 [Nematocida minor]KAI5190671.1 hypothetical protein NEMIN01_1136 [Nematocida minor]